MLKVSDRVRLRRATTFRGAQLERGTEGRVAALLEDGSSRVAVAFGATTVQWPNALSTLEYDLELVGAGSPSPPVPFAGLALDLPDV